MESELLRADLARLIGALWSAVATLGGTRVEAMCRRLGDAAYALRAGKMARRDFAREIEELFRDGAAA